MEPQNGQVPGSPENCSFGNRPRSQDLGRNPEFPRSLLRRRSKPLGKDAKPSPARQFGPGTSGGRWRHRLPFCFWGGRDWRLTAHAGEVYRKKTLTLPSPASGRGKKSRLAPARPFSRLREKAGMRVFLLRPVSLSSPTREAETLKPLKVVGARSSPCPRDRLRQVVTKARPADIMWRQMRPMPSSNLGRFRCV